MAPSTGGMRGSVGCLPAEVTHFLGRRHELAEVKRRMADARLVTLMGPGGVGKTRLALRAAAEAQRAFHGRVWFVQLADLHEPALLANTVADQLGLYEQYGRPAVETIISRIAAEPVLLLLDNCEHLVDVCADFAQSLLRECPELRVLVTSRQSLTVQGERTFQVPALSVPSPGDRGSPESVAQYDSVRLFIERGTSVVPDFGLTADNFQTVAQVCHDLDGIPLAIELAAVRLRSLSLGQIAQRVTQQQRLPGSPLRAGPARHRTLQAMIDWSYELCSEAERRVWARASVFSGSFDLDAAEHVTSGDGVAKEDMFTLVDALVDKSIFLREEAGRTLRYRMLETTRSYGEDKLTETGERTAVRRRHRDVFAALAKRFAVEWIGADEEDWFARLYRDHANLRAALDFCATEPGEAVTGLRMATQLDDYWAIRGYLTEARMWTERLLAAGPEPTPARTSGLRMNGWFAQLQGNTEAAAANLPEAAKLAEQLDDFTESAYLDHCRGMAAIVEADLDRAATLFDHAYTQFQAVDDLRGELLTQFMCGLVLGVKGDRARGLELLNACIDRTVGLGDVYWRSYALWAYAFVELLAGNVDTAEESSKQAVGLEAQLTNKLAMAFTLDTLAWIDAERGRYVRAATLFGIAGAVWEEIGASPDNYPPFALAHHHYTDLTRQALHDEAYNSTVDCGYRLSTTDAVSYALGTESESEPARTTGESETVLTRREWEVAQLVAEGRTNREIASQLVISRRTAEAHVEHILTKLAFTSRTQIASWVAGQTQY